MLFFVLNERAVEKSDESHHHSADGGSHRCLFCHFLCCGSIVESRKRGDCYECRRVKKTTLGKTDAYIIEQFAKHKVEVDSEKLTTRKMVITANDATSYLYHAPTATMKNILLTLEENVDKLKWNDDFEPLRIEGKNPNNVKRKQQRGVVSFFSYNYEYNGQEFIIGMENRGNRYEVPYFI